MTHYVAYNINHDHIKWLPHLFKNLEIISLFFVYIYFKVKITIEASNVITLGQSKSQMYHLNIHYFTNVE
jgi:hypothetical protein